MDGIENRDHKWETIDSAFNLKSNGKNVAWKCRQEKRRWLDIHICWQNNKRNHIG